MTRKEKRANLIGVQSAGAWIEEGLLCCKCAAMSHVSIGAGQNLEACSHFGPDFLSADE